MSQKHRFSTRKSLRDKISHYLSKDPLTNIIRTARSAMFMGALPLAEQQMLLAEAIIFARKATSTVKARVKECAERRVDALFRMHAKLVPYI